MIKSLSNSKYYHNRYSIFLKTTSFIEGIIVKIRDLIATGTYLWPLDSLILIAL